MNAEPPWWLEWSQSKITRNADEPAGAREVAVDWCPNLDCPSKPALPGLLRVGVNLNVCDVCSEELSGPFSAYGGHRNLHP